MWQDFHSTCRKRSSRLPRRQQGAKRRNKAQRKRGARPLRAGRPEASPTAGRSGAVIEVELDRTRGLLDAVDLVSLEFDIGLDLFLRTGIVFQRVIVVGQ